MVCTYDGSGTIDDISLILAWRFVLSDPVICLLIIERYHCASLFRFVVYLAFACTYVNAGTMDGVRLILNFCFLLLIMYHVY